MKLLRSCITIVLAGAIACISAGPAVGVRACTDTPGPGVARSTIGALQTGRYRLVMLTPSGRHVRGHVVRIVRPAG